MKKFEKYKDNLCVVEDKVFSYETNVARIEGDKLIVLGHWSQTTTKHINYVAREMNLTIEVK